MRSASAARASAKVSSSAASSKVTLVVREAGRGVSAVWVWRGTAASLMAGVELDGRMVGA
jgi:hypothetical protein